MIDSKVNDRINILAGDDRLTYKPSVDVTYGSAAKTYGSKVLAIILTGMGADGAEGAVCSSRLGLQSGLRAKIVVLFLACHRLLLKLVSLMIFSTSNSSGRC